MAVKRKNKTPKARKGPKQKFLEGMEPPSIPEIDAAAESYLEARDGRMGLLRQELERQELLHQLMKTHKLAAYEYDGKTVTVEPLEKVKVRRKKEAADDE